MHCGADPFRHMQKPWAYEDGVTLFFTRTDRRVKNAYIDSFNGRFRDERLTMNEHWFSSKCHARTAMNCAEWSTVLSGAVARLLKFPRMTTKVKSATCETPDSWAHAPIR